MPSTRPSSYQSSITARPHDGAAPAGEATASSVDERGEEHEHAKRSSGWLVGGGGDQGLESGAIVPRIVRGMVQSLPDGIEVRVSGW